MYILSKYVPFTCAIAIAAKSPLTKQLIVEGVKRKELTLLSGLLYFIDRINVNMVAPTKQCIMDCQYSFYFSLFYSNFFHLTYNFEFNNELFGLTKMKTRLTYFNDQLDSVSDF